MERIITSIGSIGLNEAAFGLVAPPWSMPMMIDIIGRRQAEKVNKPSRFKKKKKKLVLLLLLVVCYIG